MKLNNISIFSYTEAFVEIKVHEKHSGLCGSARNISGRFNRDELEDLESCLASIGAQIRDFRMKNFPESENIDE